MRRALTILILFGAMGIMMACGSMSTDADSEMSTNTNSEERFSEYNEDLSITTDKITGCKYIIYSDVHIGAGGITPLMLSDGTQDCEIGG